MFKPRASYLFSYLHICFSNLLSRLKKKLFIYISLFMVMVTRQVLKNMIYIIKPKSYNVKYGRKLTV